MKVLIIGAAGMVGRKLAERISADGAIDSRAVSELQLVDIFEPVAPAGTSLAIAVSAVDLSAPGSATKLIAARPDVIFHLAAIVSGEAEADFTKGYRINLDGTRDLFEAIRTEGEKEPYCPRVVFSSSIAVFGAPFPTRIPDDYHLTPLTSYGTQKAIGEMLLADYSRRGIFDGVGIRLPTICIRPGKPNAAASGFFSGILREPINGQEALLPVADTVRHWFASPRSAIGFCLHAASLSGEKIGPRRNLSMPGLSATVAEEIESLGRIVGEKAVKLIRRESDPTIEGIVAGWPSDFDTSRALALGFQSETTFDDIIRVYLEDEQAA
ncbi:MAG: D-erythronate dehydrogenase [Burkholderiaceae bacterium]